MTPEISGVYTMNQYGSYFVPDEFANRVVPSVLLKREVYEPKTIEFIRNNCGNGDIVTAGAFIGDFLPALHGALAADAKIWTFEANPASSPAEGPWTSISCVALF